MSDKQLYFCMNLYDSKYLVFYTEKRISDFSLPEGIYKYSIGTDKSNDKLIGKNIKENFEGSLLTLNKISDWDKDEPTKFSLDSFSAAGLFKTYTLTQIKEIKRVNELCGSLFPLWAGNAGCSQKKLCSLFDVIKYIREQNSNNDMAVSGKPVPSIGFYDSNKKLFAVYEGHSCTYFDEFNLEVEKFVEEVNKNILFIM